MKIFLLLFTILLINHSFSQQNSNKLINLKEYHFAETILDQMAQMGVDFYNSKEKNSKLILDSVNVENVKVYGAIEKDIVYKIKDQSKTLGYQIKWYDIIPEESKYLVDKSTLIEQLDVEKENSTEIAIFEDHSYNKKFRLKGPLNIFFQKNVNTIFENPKRVEIHSPFNSLSLKENSEIIVSNIKSISLAKPLPVSTSFVNGELSFEIKDVPSLKLSPYNKKGNLKFASNEKYKLKIDEIRKSASIQPVQSKTVEKTLPIFTETMVKSYIEIAQKMQNKENLKITEISNAKYNNINLVQIPAKLKQVENNISHDYLIYVVSDQNKLYVSNVERSVATPQSLISFPHLVNQTFATQIFEFLNRKPIL